MIGSIKNMEIKKHSYDNINKNVLLVYFIYNFARVLPHAVLTLILFDKNISLQQIVLIQSFYFVAVILFEIPSGFISDIWSKKLIFIIGVIFSAMSYTLILFFDDIFVLCFSWFLYGLSSASISGTIENIAINKMKKREDNEKIHKFTGQLTKTSLVSGIFGGLVGSIIYRYNYDFIYIFALILFAVSIITCVILIPNIKEDRKEKKESIISVCLKYKIIIFLIASISFFTTTFYQFWQVVFSDLGINENFFGILYIVFQLLGIAGTFVFQKKININYLFVIIVLIFVLNSLLINSNLITMLIYFLAVLAFYVTSNSAFTIARQSIDNLNISTIMSAGGSVINIVSLILMSLIYILVKYVDIVTISFILFSIYFLLNYMIVNLVKK